MNAREALRAGVREISANKFRSALSFTAVSVGVASLLYTLAQTQGMKQALERNLELMGPGRMTIEKKRDYVSKGLSGGLTYADAVALRRELPDLYMVDPRSSYSLTVHYGGRKLEGVDVAGTTPDFRKRDWVYTLRGRFLNEWDVANRARVAVLVQPAGWVKKPFWAKFWGREDDYDKFAARVDVLGQRVRIVDSVYTVVGVLTPPPRDLDPRWDSWSTPNAFVPITAFQQTFGKGDASADLVDEIRVETGDERTLAARRRQIEAILKRRHRGEEDFEIKDQREEIESEMENMRKYVKAGLALGIVALLAGGIGIMNVTLATIFARVREIGVRRAIGAGRDDILAQFLLEAAMLGAAGGLAGVGLGLGGVKWLSGLGGTRDLAQPTVLHCLGVVALASAVSAGFALVPAWRASRLDPVEALKAE
ncbi:MAG: ABC transporter permease [Elusimicrobiota bacterium]|nr:MAG: ABC transporter permease [Elusimicrobiota bacterium]